MNNALVGSAVATIFFCQIARRTAIHKRLMRISCFTSFTPSSGPIGTNVTITGTNFNSVPANNIIYFGAVRATVTSGTTTSLNVTVPAGATYQPISVLDNSTGLTGYSLKPSILCCHG